MASTDTMLAGPQSQLQELIRLLEAFIEENGQWERAARRTDFWLALRGRDLLGQELHASAAGADAAGQIVPTDERALFR